MMKNLPPVLPTTPQPFWNIISVGLLALSYAHAFVISSPQKHGSWGVPARSRERRRLVEQVSYFRRGGASPSPSPLTPDGRQQTSSSSQVNVLKAPPASFLSLGNDYENGEEYESSLSGITNGNGHYMEGREKQNGESASASSSSSINGRIPVSLLRKGGFQEKRNGKRPLAHSARAEYVAETKLPTDIGQFKLRAYRIPGAPVGQEPCVIYARDKPPMGTKGNPARHVPVRIHDQCLTSEVFRSQRCDCKEQLQMALHYIQKHGGFIVYLQQEGRGIGLANKIAAYELQDMGFDTVDANLHLGFKDDQREYDVIPSILEDMNVASIHLMTNNPRKVERLLAMDVDVERTLPMVVSTVNPYNRKYMETKQSRMNHANLSKLLAQDPNRLKINSPSSSHMNSRRSMDAVSLVDQYINNGTEMLANAVQVSLMVEDVIPDPAVEEGVKAHSDGYCFGRESVELAIKAIARGEMVVVVDDMDRENEGDFIMAADQCTPLDMAQIVRYSSGVVCIALEEERLEALKLPPMVALNEDPKGTAFTVTVDATKENGITTGISASDRAKTVQLLANPSSTALDFHRPGHILPLRARPGGVLTRDGHTEAAVDLARLAGRQPAGVLCEIVSEENPTEMMRLPEIKRFCKRHGFVLTSIVDIAQYRRETELFTKQ